MLRIGAATGVIGAIVFAIANMLHARSDDIETYAEQVKAVADSDIWITDHLLLFAGGILVAVVLGLISLVTSFYQSYDGLSVFITNRAFAGAATLLTGWVLIMAILIGRKTMQADARGRSRRVRRAYCEPCASRWAWEGMTCTGCRQAVGRALQDTSEAGWQVATQAQREVVLA